MDSWAVFDWVRHGVAGGFLGVGVFFMIVGAIGVVRFPDFYTRLHGAGVTDTMGAEFILIGLVVMSPDVQTALKLLVVMLFLFITSPTATHAIANAAYSAGVAPMLERFRSQPPDQAKRQTDEGGAT